MGLDIYFHKTKCLTSDNFDEIEAFDDNDIKVRFTKTVNQASKKFNKVYDGGNEDEIKSQAEKFINAVRPYFNHDFHLDKLKDNDLTPELINEWYEERLEHMHSTFCAYFRKVNFIWRYFEDKGDVSFMGAEWCFVTVSDLDALISSCEAVLKHYASEFKAMKKEAAKADNNPDYKIDWESNIFKLEDNDDFAAQTLPTQGGFFFGSTSYDYWYLLDVEDALVTFKKLRKNLHPEKERLYVYFSY